MIVISDTTPLNYLVLIGQQELLAHLFERVIVPQAVWTELQAEGTPESVQVWLANQPDWLEVRQAKLSADAALSVLDHGEQEAILLAQELHADLLLIDDKEGRLEATRRNLAVVGTLGVLSKAAERNLLDLPKTLASLQQTSFRASAELITALLEQDAQRKLRQRFE
jgi:predicted nucleic acid-binding protein